jgi:hypothetical protein
MTSSQRPIHHFLTKMRIIIMGLRAIQPLILTVVCMAFVPKMSSDLLRRSEAPHLRPLHLSRVMALRGGGGHAEKKNEGYRIPLEPCTEDPQGLLDGMPDYKPAPRYLCCQILNIINTYACVCTHVLFWHVYMYAYALQYMELTVRRYVLPPQLPGCEWL